MASAIRMDMSTVLILLVKSLWFSRGTVLVTITSSISEACAQPEDEQVLQRAERQAFICMSSVSI